MRQEKDITGPWEEFEEVRMDACNVYGYDTV